MSLLPSINCKLPKIVKHFPEPFLIVPALIFPLRLRTEHTKLLGIISFIRQ